MEQFNHIYLGSESQPAAAQTVGFDVLRAAVAARQAASPTVRALSMFRSADGTSPPANELVSLIDMFARGTAPADRFGRFARDEAVIRQDERHA